MFTGLIEEVGTIVAVYPHDQGTELQIAAPRAAKDVNPGESIAVNGCCLTLTSCRGDCLAFDLLDETIGRTNLRALQQDSPVNLERALRADARLGGHFVQGHVDCVAPILAFDRKGADFRLEVAFPKSFVLWIIPYTRSHTNLHRATIGDLVNVEFDILAKYVERMVRRQ